MRTCRAAAGAHAGADSIRLSHAGNGANGSHCHTGYRPSPTPSPLPRTSYTLTAVLNYEAHLLVVDERIDYTSRFLTPWTSCCCWRSRSITRRGLNRKCLGLEDGTPCRFYLRICASMLAAAAGPPPCGW